MMTTLDLLRYSIDLDTSRCQFHANGCSGTMVGHGGLQLHHEVPEFLGGLTVPSNLLALCPNHHARQHALVRYLIECDHARVAPAHRVVVHFTKAERAAASAALAGWHALAEPWPLSWSVPAAR